MKRKSSFAVMIKFVEYSGKKTIVTKERWFSLMTEKEARFFFKGMVQHGKLGRALMETKKIF